MTHAEIDKLEAGRGMDAFMAEEVMGWTGKFLCRPKKNEGEWCTAFMNQPENGLGSFNRFYKEDGSKVYCGEPHRVYFPHWWSKSIASAWEVLHLGHPCGWFDGYYLLRHGPGYAIARLSTHHVIVAAPTAPLAICFGALLHKAHTMEAK